MIVIEIAADRVVVTQLRHRRGRQPEILASVSEHHDVDLTDEVCWLDATKTTIQSLARRIPGRGVVVLLLPDRLVFEKRLSVPALAPRDRAAAIAFEASQGLPLPAEQLCVETREVWTDGRSVDVHLAATKRELVGSICRAALAEGWDVAGVFSRTRALGGSTNDASAVLLSVYVQKMALTLVFSARGGERGRSLPFVEGGERFSRDLANDAARFVSQSIAGFRCGPLSGLEWIELADSPSSDLRLEFERTFGMPAKTVEWRTDDGDAVPSQALAAFGWARLKGAGAFGPGLLPGPIDAERTIRFRRKTWFAIAAMVALALLAVIVGLDRLRRDALIDAAIIENDAKDLRTQSSRRARRQAEAKRTADAIEALNTLTVAKTAWLQRLASLQAVVSEAGEAWLDELTVAKPPVTSAVRTESKKERAPRDTRLALRGRLIDVANPTERLSDDCRVRISRLLEAMRGLEWVSSISDERFDGSQAGVVRFEMTLLVAPEWSTRRV